MKKIIALLLATLMIAAMATSAVLATAGASGANGVAHTITITNTDQNVSHTYEAYQVFSGNLDGSGTKLSNIEWGDGVNGSALLTALKASQDPLFRYDPDTGKNVFADCTSAADVAKVLTNFPSTGKYTASGTENTGFQDMPAGAIDAFASIVAEHLTSTKSDFTESGTYTATVGGDGYYFIKDTTSPTILNGSGTTESGTTVSDTASKYILAVVKDTVVEAKDTGITVDKKINSSGSKVDADSSNIGDTVTFEVTVNVPNTKKYEDHFIFVMNDQLPTGMTFTGIQSVTVGSKTLSDASLTSTNHTASGYNGDNGFYTLKVGANSSATPAVPTITSGSYPWSAAGYDAVAAAGGQKIELTFNEFKKFVEKNNLIGQTITVTYTAVVNDDAEFTATENENEVKFEYSNNPNHDYHGDNKSGSDPTGVTPESTTRTYTTSIKILKVKDDKTTPLPGAIFKLSSTDAMNRTVLTGEKFVTSGTTASGLGETINTTTKYWKLKDGSYTTTDPATLSNTSKYESTTQVYFKATYNVVEEAATSKEIIVASDANGVIQFTGLDAGTYTLEEIAAPEGYNRIEEPATIIITWADPLASGTDATAKTQGGYLISGTFADGTFSYATESGTSFFKIQVVNESGTELPSTGGIGTTIFYIVGGLLAVGAGVVLVTKKRMGKEEN